MATDNPNDVKQQNLQGSVFRCDCSEDEIQGMGISELFEILEENEVNYENLVTDKEMRELVITLMRKGKKETKQPDNSEPQKAFSSEASQKGAELVGKILEKDEKRKKCLCDMYTDIEKFMNCENVDIKLREEMTTEFGNTKGVIEIDRNREELMEIECPIVVAGETAAGKSSLLNLLLGSDFLPHSLLTCTTTICRLKNYDTKEVFIVDKENQTTRLDLPPEFLDVEMMKSKLKKYVSSTDNFDKYKYVDIHWPIPILKSQAIIVDTPGIGSNEELTKRLYEYLTKAVAFIYVINSSNAGGVQSDRLEKIFEVQKEGGKMYEFDPTRAIFVCNKWDQVSKAEEDTVWNNTVEKLKKHWPNFQEKQMFKLSTKEETRRASTPGLEYTSNFQNLLKGIGEMIPASLEAKVSRHSGWQKQFLDQLMKRIVARIKLSRKTEDEKKKIKGNIEERIKKLKHNIQEVKLKVKATAEELCTDISNRLHSHLNSRETKGKIFLWSMSELPSQADFEVIEYQAKKLIIKRINEETREWCNKNDVNNLTQTLSNLFTTECKLIEAQCDEINRTLLDISMPFGEGLHDYATPSQVSHDPLFTKHEKIVLAVTSPLWLPLVVGAGLIALPFGVAAGMKDLVQQTRKINDYNSNKLKYMMDWSDTVLKEFNQNAIYKLMEDTYLKDFNVKVDHVCEHVIPKQIAADEQFIDNIKNDIRSSCQIRKQYQPLETTCKCMLGKLLLIFMDYFSGHKISSDDIKRGSGIEEIGKGQFADVHVAEVILNGKWTKAAVKTLRRPLEKTDSYVQLTEVENLRKLHHPNIVELYGVSYKLGSQSKKFLQIYMEFCDDSLDEIVFKKRTPKPCYKCKDILACKDSWDFYLHMMCGVCKGLVHVHNKGFVHRDLKLANILVKNGEAKIADVGLAKEEEDILGTVTGTPTTMAPEVLKGKIYGTEADIFSVGIILWEMWYARPGYTHPLDESKEYEFIAKNFNQLSEFITKGTRPDFETPHRPPNKLQFLIKRCWDNDISERPKAEDVLKVLNDLEALKKP